jgi:hypothetical protein
VVVCAFLRFPFALLCSGDCGTQLKGAIDYYTHVGGGYGDTQSGIDWHTGNETSNFDDSGNFTTDLLVPHTIAWLKRKATNPVCLSTLSALSALACACSAHLHRPR